MNRNGIMAMVDEKGREKERYQVVYGAKILVSKTGQGEGAMQVLLEWDPYTFSILTEISGAVHFKDSERRHHDAGAGGRSHRPVAVGGHGFARREAPAGDHRPARRAAASTTRSAT